MAIVDIKQKTLPGFTRTGTQQGVQTVTWEIQTDEPHAGGHLIILAQLSAAGNGPLPQRGDVLAVDDGIVVAGITAATGPAWVAADPTQRYGDGGAYALDFSVEPLEGGRSKNYLATIGFRAPQAGRLERTGFLNKFNAGLTFPTPPTVLEGITAETVTEALELDTEPVEVRTEFIMQENVFGIEDLRRIDQEGKVAASAGPLRNPLGQAYDPLPSLERIPVAVVTRIVGETGDFASAMNFAFARTMSNDAIVYEGLIYPAYHTRYLYAENSSVQSEGGKGYRVLTYRIALSNQPFWETRPATGSFFLAQAEGPATQGGTGPGLVFSTLTDSEGHPIIDEYPLTIDGRRAGVAGEQFTEVYTRYRPVNYGNLLATP